MKVLVTGGAGFIGSHVVEELLAHDHQVTAIDNLSTGRRENLPLKCGLLEADCLGTRRLTPYDAVIHLAALSSVQACERDPKSAWLLNYTMTAEYIADEIRPDAKFVFASSGAVKGNGDGPLSHYARTKLAAEMWLGVNRPDATIFRLGNVYGPRQRPDLEAGVIAKWFALLRQGQPIPMTGDGSQTRSFVYVKDVAKAMVRALDHPGGPIECGGCDGPVSILNLNYLVWRTAGHAQDAWVKHFIPRPPGEVDHTELRQGPLCGTNLLKGLRLTWESLQ